MVVFISLLGVRMKHISETWICKELKLNLNHSAKVLGMHIWLKSDFGERKVITTMQELIYHTHISDSNIRRGLKALERFEFIKVEHPRKTSKYVIELCMPSIKLEIHQDPVVNKFKPKFDIFNFGRVK